MQIEGSSREISSVRNKLGIFSAVKEGNSWTKIRELRFNNEWYNISTPYLSPDGKRLYFASDMPDGYGGSDLYYCQWEGDYWDEPVNLGSTINTKGNEAYPFITPAGEILFASDGHPGLGGKDIFYSRPMGNDWLHPVRLDSPINSQFDDFGIITDSLMSEGYFSSNRLKTIDIYRFKTRFPQIFYADIQRENQYCFTFTDSGAITVDTLNLRYVWDFGDGKKAYGEVVHHCFPGPGNYNVKLDIIDRSTGNLFFSKLKYALTLRDYEQPFITSPDVAVVGEQINLNGNQSYLPGYETLLYSWEFGEGTRMTGPNANVTFKAKGEFNINMGVKLKSLTTGIIHNTGITKKISVVNNDQERKSYLAAKASVKESQQDIRRFENAIIKNEYSAEEDYKKDAVFRIRLISSEKKISFGSTVFRNLPDKYTLKEVYDSESGTYYYVADEQIRLMSVYPAYKELSGLGFKNLQIVSDVLSSPAEKELLNDKKNYGVLADDYFDTYGRLKANAYLMLDQIVILMNRNPGIRLEVEVHTDNTGSAPANLKLSQTRAQLMVNYLINRGISSKRLTAKGYGGVKPVASNMQERDRRQNRRVDFRIIN